MAIISDWFNDTEQQVPNISPQGGEFDTWTYNRDYSAINVSYTDQSTLTIDIDSGEETWH